MTRATKSVWSGSLIRISCKIERGWVAIFVRSKEQDGSETLQQWEFR